MNIPYYLSKQRVLGPSPGLPAIIRTSLHLAASHSVGEGAYVKDGESPWARFDEVNTFDVRAHCANANTLEQPKNKEN